MSDLDPDLMALLAPGVAQTAAQSEPQGPAAAAPELDIGDLLAPVHGDFVTASDVAALAEQDDEPGPESVSSQLPVMHDSEGRKLGPTGLYLALQRDLRLARAAGDQAEIRRLEALVRIADQGVEAFSKKSGLSRAELFPSASKSRQSDQQEALDEIARLKARVEALQREASKLAANSVARFKRLLEVRSLQGQAALVARQAGLIDASQLTEAGNRGVWTLIDLDFDRGAEQSHLGENQDEPNQQADFESDRP